MSTLTPLLILLTLLSYSLQWYSRCDEAGRCTISETESSEQIYLTPGFLPLFPEGNIIPKPTPGTGSPSFSVDAIQGFSPYDPLSGNFKYECAGGLSECAFSCCKAGHCADTMHSCRVKSDTCDLIYILTSAVFVVFIIVYWVTYFVLGCRYNKHIVKTQKNQQQYGSVVKDNQPNPANHTIEEQSKDEVDEPGMRTHGSIQVDDYQQGKNQVDPEEEKRKKMTLIASRIGKIGDNNGDGVNEEEDNNNNVDQQEEDQKEVSVSKKKNQYGGGQYQSKEDQGEISINSKQDDNELSSQSKKNNPTPNVNVNNISDNFDEINLDDMQ